jgi:hypothetical protein
MRAAVVSKRDVSYPAPDDAFSPGERYPEYPFDRIAHSPNPVYEMVRRSLLDLGLDAENFGSPRWNPLASKIAPGSQVFILCNFVYHRRLQESDEGFASKCIHGSVLRAICDYVYLATGPSGRIRFGNSPLQACDWKAVQNQTGASVVEEFFRKHDVDVQARDLRLHVIKLTALGRVRHVDERDDSSNGVEISLGEESLLHEISSQGARPAPFRVLDYKASRIEAFHANNRHRYVIHRDVLESDTILSLSKLKTHQKVGITCGLKGFVGIVGHKDCLPHHRFGSPEHGGDEYPPGWTFLELFSRFQDFVQSREHGGIGQGLLEIIDRTSRRVLGHVGAPMGGAWYGNDTCWRMAVDLARIAHYADSDGTMHDRPVRRNLSLIDGIVGGEGDGPLSPSPISSGVVILSDDIPFGDRVAARVMGFDPDTIPLVRESTRRIPHSLWVDGSPLVTWNGRELPEADLLSVAKLRFRPPRGWRGRLEAGG